MFLLQEVDGDEIYEVQPASFLRTNPTSTEVSRVGRQSNQKCAQIINVMSTSLQVPVFNVFFGIIYTTLFVPIGILIAVFSPTVSTPVLIVLSYYFVKFVLIFCILIHMHLSIQTQILKALLIKLAKHDYLTCQVILTLINIRIPR